MTPRTLTVGVGRVQATFMLRSALQRLGGRRARRAAFWYLGPERLVVAVIEPGAGPGDDEPLLTACATVAGRAQTPLAAGLLEAAVVVGSSGLEHVAALDERHCRVIASGSVDAAPPGPAPRRATEDRPTVEVAGPSGSRLQADRDVLEWAARLFDAAALRLARVDCAALARARLAAHLGRPPGAGRRAADPLTAVSVATACERAAVELGALLEVPVGLAVGRFLRDPPAAERALEPFQACGAIEHDLPVGEPHDVGGVGETRAGREPHDGPGCGAGR